VLLAASPPYLDNIRGYGLPDIYIYTRLILPKAGLPTGQMAQLEVTRVRLLGPRRVQTVGRDRGKEAPQGLNGHARVRWTYRLPC